MTDLDPTAVHLQTANPPKAITPEHGSLSIDGTVQGSGFQQLSSDGVSVVPQGVFTPSGSLTAWKALAAKAATQQVCVMVLGDSIAQGALASNWYTKGWAGLVRAGLVARYGQLAGDYVPSGDSAFAATGIDAGSVQCLFSSTAGLGTSPMQGYSYNRTLALNDTITFTPIQPFIDFDLLVNQQNGWSPFSLTVDGVAQTASIQEYVNNSGVFTTAAGATLSFNSTAADADTSPHRWVRYRGWSGAPFSSATHTVVLTATGGGGQCNVGGIQVYPKGRTAPGIVFVKHAVYGKTARELGLSGWAAQFPNYNVTKATVSDWLPAPNLVIVELGINDVVNGYSTNLLSIALDNLCREATRAGASLLFVAPYWTTNAYWRGNGINTLVNLAYALNAPVVNASALFGGDAGAAPYVTSAGNSHPNDAGHALIASAVLSIL